MNAVFRIILISLKYLVNVGPLLYEATQWGIKIAREIRRKKTAPPVEVIIPEKPIATTKADFDPG
ncbi:MAG: hypothetical protein D4R64_15375 [Porphyromonadaceae bacterium]|nr:MAG: hypothetical protein D4R64_15375 [Porphyromonadaceae bacterium]